MTDLQNAPEVPTGQLARFAENTARTMQVRGTAPARREAARTRQALRRIAAAHTQTARRWGGLPGAPGWTQWLLDNWYLAQREGAAAAQALQHARRLPACGGRCAVTQLCAQLVRVGRGEVTAIRCRIFLEGCQNARVLSRRELNAVPAGLRAALVQALAALCRRAEKTPDEPALEGLFAAVFTSLRLLGTLDLGALLERVDRAERILRGDPAGVYARMDRQTRQDYLRRLERLARRAGISEHRAARRVLRLAREGEGAARHVGWFLFCQPLGRPARVRRGGLYVAANVVATLFLALLGGFATHSAVCALALLLPASELVRELMDFLILRLVPPARLPRMALEDGVPDRGRTLCAVSCLLTDEKAGPALARRLEEFRLCNRDCGENLRFALLADLPDTAEEALPEGEARIAAAQAAVDGLNAKYGGGFYLFTRPRTYSAADRRWMGRERKRGAIEALVLCLAGRESPLVCRSGDEAALTGTRFLLCLDADTRLVPGAARELIGTMLHPLNRPVIDHKRRTVRRGFGVLAPRIGVELSSACGSAFARVHAGVGGVDPYGSACGEVYMDLFGRGGFAGKGLIDVRAFLTCLEGRFPENRVLSHDALEGAFLHAGFVGDVELTDGFPQRPAAYFRRMHRWTRGDWQNAPWLFGKKRVPEPLERWKLFDSLRRSLLPPACFAALLWGLLAPSAASAAAAAAAFLALAARLLTGLAAHALRREPGREKHHAGVLWGVRGALAWSALRLWLLPAEAWTCLSACVTALWRMTVSHRGLLEWQTAAQAERGGSVREAFSLLWAAVPTGVALIVWGTWLGAALGAAWILAPGLLPLLERTPGGTPLPGPAERGLLLLRAGEIWRFFERFVTAENHFLPPDNWQEQPPVGLARRTSPTNLGLFLTAALAALDLGLTTPERVRPMLEGFFDSLSRLERWHGHFYNWYDTARLCPLRPAYVSTVDSGNLAACLLTASGGLAEYGFDALARQARALYDGMELGRLYDPQRRLFSIGFDAEKGRLSESWYDLLSSEARLTAYLAVARGDVPRRCWRALSRAQVACCGYRGTVSWTGTMFEYLMPELFLPLERGSLLFESAKFCLFVQKRRTAGRLRLWGISESAFAALDPALNYRYKAHGCPALALRRGMEDDLVISPYSSFLALCVEPEAAVKNLRALQRAGLLGPYGFWEAADFTPGRRRGPEGTAVRCVMAHHLGMSITAAANRLCENSMVRRFLAEPCMTAFRPLLQERVPVGAPLLRRGAPSAGAPRAARTPGEPARAGAGADFEAPAATLLSNGAYGLAVSETGQTRARLGALAVYRDATLGGTPALWLCRGEAPELLLPADGTNAARHWSLSGSQAVFQTEHGTLQCRTAICIPAQAAGELRTVTLRDGEGGEASLCLVFEPVLAPPEDARSHPAYWRLGLEAVQRDGMLLIRRLARGGVPETWMALACSRPMHVTAGRAAVSPRAAAPIPAACTAGDALVCARTALTLRAGQPAQVCFALCLGRSADEACAGARQLLAAGDEQRAALPSACAALLGMDAAETEGAMQTAARLLFFTRRPRSAPGVPRQALWRFGVSGDLPVVCAQLTDEPDGDFVCALLRRHALLTDCGLAYDLVFCTDEGGAYLRPARQAVERGLQRLQREQLLGRPGGVHVADGPGAQALWDAADAHEPPQAAQPSAHRHEPGVQADAPRFPAPAPDALPSCRWSDDGSFGFDTAPALPPRAWQLPLTNGAFGYLAADTGCGSMWYRSARECPVSPWQGDPLAIAGPETLEAEADGAFVPLFAAPASGPCRVTFGPGWARWERQTDAGALVTHAFVPPEAAARVLLVEPPAPIRLHWRLALQLAPNARDAEQAETACRDGVFSARNVRAPFPAQLYALGTCTPEGFTCCGRSAALRAYDGAYGTGGAPCLAGVWTVRGPFALVCGADSPETLARLADPDEARAALDETRAHWRARVCRIRTETGNARLDRLLSGWLPYQALACRMLARCSLYQCGGAIGFRDQLQDAVNLLPLDAAGTRAHILLCCTRQFSEGDVQHWWHPETGAGVRTRCSDDLLWLPWAVCEYVEATGDRGILDEERPCLGGMPLQPDERERFEAPPEDGPVLTVTEHCRRALHCTVRRGTGAHGLPHIGSCDWNDGFSAVGGDGGGESVWLAWFFACTARRFLALTGEDDALADAACRFAAAAAACWDGDRCLRAFFDDGTPIGGRDGDACRIDAIAQAALTLCPADVPPERRQAALDTALRLLFDEESGLLRLFDPPFTGETRSPGYLTSYGAGFRENGGQYTHGAVWLARALLREGRTKDGLRLFYALLPPGPDALRYGAEPYAAAADVTTADGCAGAAGWSWYTGSAGWLWRTGLEDVLGLRLQNGMAKLCPSCLQSYAVILTDAEGREHRLEVKNGAVQTPDAVRLFPPTM